MRNLIVILAACSFLCSCSTTIHVGSDNLRDVLQEISSRSTSELFVVTFKPDSNHHRRVSRVGSSFIADKDSCFWLDTDGVSIQFALLTNLKSIRFWSQGRGALTGLAVGATGGFIVGAVVGYQSVRDASFVSPSVVSEGIALLYGILGGAGGGALGALFGGVAGSTTAYIFDQ